MHRILKGENGLPDWLVPLSGNAAPLFSTFPKAVNIASESTNLQNLANSLAKQTSNGFKMPWSTAADLTSGIIKGVTRQADNNSDQIVGQTLDTAGDLAMTIPGIGTLVGGGLKGLSALTTSVGSKIKGNKAKELTDISSAYTGLDAYGTKKFGLLGSLFGSSSRYKNRVANREAQRSLSEQILKDAQESQIPTTQNMLNAYNILTSGGWQQNNGLRFGKEGGRIASYEHGGSMNVIPEGALHAHKHSIDIDGEITKKGIPVIIENGGDITQVAEIERDEIIFTKEVTEKLEQLRDIGTDEAAIEAGKLITYEILHNTIDNTGLLNKVN